MTNNIKQLTDEARRILECWSRGETTGTCADREAAASEALRIIDAHAAERAALVAVIERVRKALYGTPNVSEALAALAGAVAPEADAAVIVARVHRDVIDKQVKRDLAAANALVAELKAANERQREDIARLAGAEQAANARIAELEESFKMAMASVAALTARLDAANARAEAAERTLNNIATQAPLAFERAESERDAWKAKCEAAELDASAWRATADGEMKHRQAAESESAQWKAKCGAAERAYQDARSAYADLEESHKASERTVAQLNAMNDRAESEAASLLTDMGMLRRKSDEDRARLAAATELLGRWMAVRYQRAHGSRADVVRDTRVFLANAPAAPTYVCAACGKTQCDGTHVGCPSYLEPARTAPTRTFGIFSLRHGQRSENYPGTYTSKQAAQDAIGMRLQGEALELHRSVYVVRELHAPAAPIRSECSECKSDWGHYAGCPNEGSVQVPTRTDHERAKPYDASFDTCDCETADEHERGACRKPCTDHERAVLDACRNAVTRVAHMGQEVLQLTQGSQQTIAEAVVAWREARGESTRIHDAERALLRIVRQRCQGSRTWMQANMSDLFTADEALRNAESYK
jgi:hypothetical protein